MTMLVVVGDELQEPLVAIIGDGKLQLENPSSPRQKPQWLLGKITTISLKNFGNY